jgi:hypothetical protein
MTSVETPGYYRASLRDYQIQNGKSSGIRQECPGYDFVTVPGHARWTFQRTLPLRRGSRLLHTTKPKKGYHLPKPM